MQCPVCQNNCESSATFCPRCAWAFKMYVGGTPPEEEQRLKVARRNWRISMSQAKTAAQNPKKNVSNRSDNLIKKPTSKVETLYSPDTPVPDLQRDAFETVEEFHQRIKEHKPVLAGTAKLIKDRYDIHTGYFPLKIDWLEWAKSFEIKGRETYITAKRDLARAIYISGPEHPVYTILQAQGEKVTSQKIELYADNRPIEINVSLFYIKPKYPLRFKPVNGVSDKKAQSFFNIDNDLRPENYIQNEFKLIHNDAVVADLGTGLMWQQSGSKESMIYEKTADYIGSINDAKLAGFDDWRLPTIDELVSLLIEEETNGLYIDPIFDNNQRWCWSCDRRAPSGAWSVGFCYGKVIWSRLDSDSYVRAVRSGQ